MNLEKVIAHKMQAGDLVLKTDLSAGAKSDTLSLQVPAHGFHINVDGSIKYVDFYGNVNTLVVKAGQSYAYGCRQVYSTGTTLANSEFSIFWGV